MNSGDIAVDKTVKSQTGDVDVTANNGNIKIGDNKDADTISAYKDVNLTSKNGMITILGKTATETGDVNVTVEHAAYNTGNKSVVFDANGQIVAAQDVKMSIKNGDLVVTDDVKAGRNLKVGTIGEGNISLGNDVNVNNEMTMTTQKGNIEVGNEIKAGTVNMTTGTGYIDVGKNVTASKNVNMQTITEGNIKIGADVEAGADVNMKVKKGEINVGADVKAANEVNMTMGEGDVTVGYNGDR